jgi:hypothetical protein
MKEDTPQDVIRAGRNASVGLKSMQFALQDTEAINLQAMFWRLQKRRI